VIECAPDCGGAVSRLTYAGVPLLRGFEGDNENPLLMGAFPMLPFCGRIGSGRFDWNGKPVQLSPNFPPEAHTIHGYGWHTEWDVEQVSDQRLTMRMQDPGKDWSWAYQAEQRFDLTAEELILTLSMTNLSGRTMPAGIGWHPYFPDSGSAQLRARVRTQWMFNDAMSAVTPIDLRAQPDCLGQSAAADLGLDHCFTHDAAAFCLNWSNPARSLEVAFDPVFGFLVVYTPDNQSCFCVEPQTHLPNALNLSLPGDQSGRRDLEPDATLSGSIRLRPVVHPADC